jgi:S-adenosylmethionine decarboxylase
MDGRSAHRQVVEDSQLPVFDVKQSKPSALPLARAGTHLIVDLWGASRLDDLAAAEGAIRLAIDAAGATLLYIHMHHFGPNAGVSGVAILAESHISIHTWPERDYAALDVFMCGRCDPRLTLPIMKKVFKPTRTVIHLYARGEESEANWDLQVC